MFNPIFWLIIGFILFGFASDHLLMWLNLQHAKPDLPEKLNKFYDTDSYNKAIVYHQQNFRLSFISSLFSTSLLLVLLFTGSFAWLDGQIAQINEYEIIRALLFFGILLFISDILSLPFSIYKTFVIENKFGFNRTSPILFVKDKLKGWILMAILGGGLLSLIIWFYQWTASWFWLIGWGIMIIVLLFITIFYTSLFIPLFNKLLPLEEGHLRSQITAFANKVAFPLKKIFVMNGSLRSSKANAFFSGLGGKKSIVLFDTLIDQHSENELIAVLAHEVGHYKKKHILSGILLSIGQTGLLFFLFGLSLNLSELPQALGIAEPSFHISLLVFSFLLTPLMQLSSFITNAVSRRNEFQADAFSAKTHGAEHLIDALEKLSVKNLSFPDPHPLFVKMHYSHPPVFARVEALERLR